MATSDSVSVGVAGKHCFVEKPLARSVADAQPVVDSARERSHAAR